MATIEVNGNKLKILQTFQAHTHPIIPERKQIQVIEANVVEEDDEKKYVLYCLQVHHVIKRYDGKLATVQRRYTQFLTLYQQLSNIVPTLPSDINFPKKALVGNYDEKLICVRSSAFELLLQYVIQHERLYSTRVFLDFLQNPELSYAKNLMCNKLYKEAIPVLENILLVLNNVYTDRSPPVLLSLCRLIACSCLIPGQPNAAKWTELAIQRFEGVSDGELLILYIPLLQLSITVWGQSGKDKSMLLKRLDELLRMGINCSVNMNLLEAVCRVELKLFGDADT